MKVFILIFCLSTVSSVYVGSFNIRSGDNFTGSYNLKKQAEVIETSGFSIVGLQEVDRDTQRHQVDEPTLLTEYTSLKHVKFTSFRRFQGGHYGIAILSKFPFLEEKEFRFKGKTEDECKEYKPGDFCQGATSVKVDLMGTKIWFVTTHLGLGGIMSQEAKLLDDWISDNLMKDGIPIFVTGDFNSLPDSETHKIMTSVFEDNWVTCPHKEGDEGYTFPSRIPTERIDYLYTFIKDESLKCKGINVVDSEVSDHRALRVQF